MSINERILQLINLKGYNKNSFCIKIGIKPQTLHNIVSGRKTKPSFNVIEKILLTFVDVNAKWLITGSGVPIVKKLQETNTVNEQTCKFDILCLEKFRDYKVLEMGEKINDFHYEKMECKIKKQARCEIKCQALLKESTI